MASAYFRSAMTTNQIRFLSQPPSQQTRQPFSRSPQLQYLRKPQKLGADFHSSHLNDSFSAFAYALVWDHVHGLCTLRFLRPSKGTGSTLSAAGAGFRTVAWHDRSKAMRCLPMCTRMRLPWTIPGGRAAGTGAGNGMTFLFTL